MPFYVPVPMRRADDRCPDDRRPDDRPARAQRPVRRLASGALLALATVGVAGAASAQAPRARATAGSGRAAAPAAAATHRVRMIGDGQGYRFEPAQLTVAPGDRVEFVMVSGGPHNVQFDEATVPAAKARLAANMPDAADDLAGPLLTTEGQTYTVSFAGLPAGTYKYVCTPHAAMNMAGTIVVRGAARRAGR